MCLSVPLQRDREHPRRLVQPRCGIAIDEDGTLQRPVEVLRIDEAQVSDRRRRVDDATVGRDDLGEGLPVLEQTTAACAK
jgi:hypothetical protein